MVSNETIIPLDPSTRALKSIDIGKLNTKETSIAREAETSKVTLINCLSNLEKRTVVKEI